MGALRMDGSTQTHTGAQGHARPRSCPPSAPPGTCMELLEHNQRNTVLAGRRSVCRSAADGMWGHGSPVAAELVGYAMGYIIHVITDLPATAASCVALALTFGGCRPGCG